MDKHFENCKTYSGNLDGSIVPPSYHVQNRRYTYLLFFHIVCSIEQGGRMEWCRWCMCYTIISTCLDFYISLELESLIGLVLENFGALELWSFRALEL